MTTGRIIEGACREAWFPNNDECERGTRYCTTHHPVRRVGTTCTRCGTPGGLTECLVSPDGRMRRCTNYAGRFGATIADREASGQS